MALPKMSVPYYTVELPSTGAELSMRPYLVREEKVLMIALESQDGDQITKAVRNIISSCYSIDDMDSLTVFDVEMLFLQLRAKSVGEEMKLQVKCKECEKMTPVVINIDDIKVSGKEQETTIMLDSTTGVGIKMKYPSLELIGNISPEKFNSVEGIMELILDCIDNIFDADNVYSAKSETKKGLEDFIDSLNSAQFKKIQDFFQDSPAVSYVDKFKCTHCETENELELKGLNSFFS